MDLFCLHTTPLYFLLEKTRSHRHQTFQAPVSIKPLVFYHTPCISIQPPPCWKRTHSADDWSSFKTLCNQYHKLSLSVKTEYYSSLVSSASDNPKRLWPTVNKLLHRKSSSPLPTTSSVTSLGASFASSFHRQNIQTPSLSHQQPHYIVSALTLSSRHSP